MTLVRRYPLESSLVALFALSLLFLFFASAPAGYPETSIVTIESRTTVSAAGMILKDDNALRSASVFSFLVRTISPTKGVIAATYSVPGGENAVTLAFRFATGMTGLTPVRVTIEEGLSSKQIGALLGQAIAPFDVSRFDTLAGREEGYLFPDTYLFVPGMTPEAVVAAMRTNFATRVEPLLPDIERSGHSLTDIVTMASIVEKEARQSGTRKIVAGILWKRITLGMPLQVDAVFGYIFATSTFSPSFAELATDSPYNTYTNKGLPPGPIDNPGLDAIEAVLNPTKTPYLYYLTGADGMMHYATTFAGHVANRKYLK